MEKSSSCFVVRDFRYADRHSGLWLPKDVFDPLGKRTVFFVGWMTEAGEDVGIQEELHEITRDTVCEGPSIPL
jgi:hypothetical protein